MRKTYKILALILALVFAVSLAACSGGGETTPTTSAGTGSENAKPVISGAKDLTVEAGHEIDVLAGLTASDKEDGDLTAQIKVESSPALTFTNGKATPANPGSYEIVYSVTDKGGQVGEAYATLTVTRQTAEPVLYKQFDFSTRTVTDAHGWEATIFDSVNATAAMKEGAYVFDIVDANSGGDDAIRLCKKLTLEPADYKIKVWVKSTKDAMMHIIARKDNDGWDVYGGEWNVRIGERIEAHEINFSVFENEPAEFRLHFGMIRFDDVPQNPDNYTVTIDKIEIYKTVGSETESVKYTADFTKNEGLSVDAGDGAAASVSYNENTAIAVIGAYPTEGGVWSIKANLGLDGLKIEEGVKYFYRFTVNASKGQNGECLVESATLFHEARVHFNGLAAQAGEDTVVSGVFVADRAIDDPVIRLQIGNPNDGVAENFIVFKNVVFGVLEGDKEVIKTIDKFVAFGSDTDAVNDQNAPFTTFNGTDEDNDLGVGTIYALDGKFFYRIDQGGVTDWHNKLICGYRENPLTLASDSYYTVEIKAKATKAVHCGVFLNPIGGWDPRVSEGMDLTTETQTFTYTTTDTLVTDMDFELLFQFGSNETAALGEVTVEFESIIIYQMKIM